jgi:tetratricopeptide (TPR) repeat protein
LAEPLFQECFELRAQTLGISHVKTLMSMYNVANMMFNQEEYDLAKRMMIDCLNQRRIALGANHLDTIASLKKLGVLHEIQKDLVAAELVYHEYLHATTAVYGSAHVNTVNTLYLLGTNYMNQHKYNLAEAVFRAAIDKYKITLGANHDFTLSVMYDLAGLYEDVAKYEESLAVRTNYYAICKAKYGEEEEEVPVVLHSTVHAVEGGGSGSGSAAAFVTPAPGVGGGGGGGNNLFAAAHHALSLVASRAHAAGVGGGVGVGANGHSISGMTGPGAQEEGHLTHIHASPLDFLKTHQCMYDMAALHIKLGKCNRALPLLVRCLELRLKFHGSMHLLTMQTQNLLAYVHINNGNYEEAEGLLVRTISDGGKLRVSERPPLTPSADADTDIEAGGGDGDGGASGAVHNEHSVSAIMDMDSSAYPGAERGGEHSQQQQQQQQQFGHGSFDYNYNNRQGDRQNNNPNHPEYQDPLQFHYDHVRQQDTSSYGLNQENFNIQPQQNMPYDDAGAGSMNTNDENSVFSNSNSYPELLEDELELPVVLDAMTNLGLMYSEQVTSS